MDTGLISPPKKRIKQDCRNMFIRNHPNLMNHYNIQAPIRPEEFILLVRVSRAQPKLIGFRIYGRIAAYPNDPIRIRINVEDTNSERRHRKLLNKIMRLFPSTNYPFIEQSYTEAQSFQSEGIPNRLRHFWISANYFYPDMSHTWDSSDGLVHRKISFILDTKPICYPIKRNIRNLRTR